MRVLLVRPGPLMYSEIYRRLEVARTLELTVALNIIADPDWDERRFALVREWALSVPEIVHLTVTTPYPGTEIWHTESRRLTTLDYRLFDVRHAVLRLALRGQTNFARHGRIIGSKPGAGRLRTTTRPPFARGP